MVALEKEILNQYIDACELVRETEEDIRRLKERRHRIEQDSVKGSMPEFPYAAKNFHVEGLPYSELQNSGQLDRGGKLLEDRRAQAEAAKRKVEEWMQTIPLRMQRIIRMKIFEQMTWEQVARRIGRKATGESLRKEFEKFMKK